MARNDDYLFDPTAPPDPEIAALERALAPWRTGTPAPPVVAADAVAGGRRRRLLAAAAALLLAAGGGAWWWARDRGPAVLPAAVDVALEEQAGAVRVESQHRVADAAGLRVGDRIVSEAGGSARIRVGEVGWLRMSEATRLRVAEGHGDTTRAGAFQLELERGTVAATIFAAPRVFALGTPGGIAVDLGCIYETTVADDGATWLRVTAGSVSFESNGRKVHVPAGAGCRAWPNYGPGTPTWNDGDAALAAAVGRHDEARARGDGAAAAVALDQVLAALGGEVGAASPPCAASPRESLPLWHLLAVPERALRERVLDRLATLVPPPAEAPREALLAGNVEALDAWREELELAW